MLLTVALLASSAAALRLPRPAAGGGGLPATCSRRAACVLPFAVPLAASAAELSVSKVFSVREYVIDLKAARRGLDDLIPPLERRDSKGYQEAREALRLPPVNGIRKPATKILKVLEGEGPLLAAKTKQYDTVKDDLAKLDVACRDAFEQDKKPDLLPEVTALQSSIDTFISGFELPPPPPPPPPPEPVPAPEAVEAS